MSLWQGVKGAQVELAAIQNPVQKLRRLGAITKLFASELVSTIALAPFAVRALQLYKSLPSLDTYCQDDVQPVYVVKDVRYGTAARSLVDLYVPSDAVAGLQETNNSPAAAGVPVVVFVHGGVWAAGDKWHYAPLASCLARLGVMACVVQYTLYPEALVPQLVEEVAAAFDWAMEHVGTYGGDRQQVSLVGHSAGAQLCMMALLQRAQAAHELSQQQKQQQSCEPQQQQERPPSMPKQFVAVTGVFDIAKHYTYEKERGVHELSTMKRAMGGFEQFAAMSPAVILGAALQQQQQQQHLGQQWTGKEQQQQHVFGALGASHSNSSSSSQGCPAGQGQQEPPACSFYDSFQLSGESIAHRIGFDRGSSHYTASEASLSLQSLAGMSEVMQFPLPAARFLPPTVLVSSCTDLTVPWYESAEMYWKLLDCGVPAKHLVYNKVGHGDFVVEWPSQFEAASSSDDWGTSSSNSSSSSNNSSSNIQQQQSAVPAARPQHNSDTDDWGSSGSAGNPSGFAQVSTQAAAGRSHIDQLAQRRHQMLQGLPHYCRDIAVVVMGQQPINFMKQQRPSAAGWEDVGSSWQQQAVSSADGNLLAAADAEMLVQAADLN